MITASLADALVWRATTTSGNLAFVTFGAGLLFVIAVSVGTESVVEWVLLCHVDGVLTSGLYLGKGSFRRTHRQVGPGGGR